MSKRKIYVILFAIFLAFSLFALIRTSYAFSILGFSLSAIFLTKVIGAFTHNHKVSLITIIAAFVIINLIAFIAMAGGMLMILFFIDAAAVYVGYTELSKIY